MDITMQEKTFADYYLAFKRRKWQFVVPAAIVLVLAVAVAMLIPAVYRATAVILIEQQIIPSELVQSTITSYADERIQVISQRVMTTTNLTQVMDKYDLYKNERAESTREDVMEKMRDDVSREMISADVIDPRSGRPTAATIAFTLSYENRSPVLAQQVTNELVSLYLNENLKSRKEKAAEASGFLNEEADRLRKQIETLEQKLAEFKEQNSGSLPELANLNLNLMERTERELLEINGQIHAAEERKIYLESELAQLSPNSVMLSEAGERVLTPQGRLKALETKYLSASAIYSEDHPDIIRMRRELESLRKEVGAPSASSKEIRTQLEDLTGQLASTRETHSDDHPDVKKLKGKIASLQKALDEETTQASEKYTESADNPSYIHLKAKVEATNAELNSLRENRKQLKAKRQEIEERIMQAPQVEREYLALNRDHTNAVAKYQEVITKHMSAQMAEELERDSKGERFSLIEPPLLPEKPVKPNRLAIIFLGAILAMGVGIGYVLLVESFDKSIRSEKDIASIFGMPPLATIPYIVTDVDIEQAKHNKMKLVAGFVLVAIVSFALVHFLYKPLDILWFVAQRKLGF